MRVITLKLFPPCHVCSHFTTRGSSFYSSRVNKCRTTSTSSWKSLLKASLLYRPDLSSCKISLHSFRVVVLLLSIRHSSSMQLIFFSMLPATLRDGCREERTGLSPKKRDHCHFGNSSRDQGDSWHFSPLARPSCLSGRSNTISRLRAWTESYICKFSSCQGAQTGRRLIKRYARQENESSEFLRFPSPFANYSEPNNRISLWFFWVISTRETEWEDNAVKKVRSKMVTFRRHGAPDCSLLLYCLTDGITQVADRLSASQILPWRARAVYFCTTFTRKEVRKCEQRKYTGSTTRDSEIRLPRAPFS